MNGNLTLRDPCNSVELYQFRIMLAVGASIIGLVLILFWPNTARAQASSCGSPYTVQSGDTINGIASRHRTSPGRIRSCNNLSSDAVRRGQQLQVPGQASSSSNAGSRYTRDESGSTSTGSSTSPSGGDQGIDTSGNNNDSNSSSNSGNSTRNKAKRRK